MLESLIGQSRGGVKLVGSSLGGFYAAWLAEKYGLKAVHINPCVACHKNLADVVGQVQKNWHSGVEYTFTAQHLAELEALQLPAIQRPEHHLLMIETGDEVLDYREAVAYFQGARQVILEGGDHGFTRFTEYLPMILEF